MSSRVASSTDGVLERVSTDGGVLDVVSALGASNKKETTRSEPVLLLTIDGIPDPGVAKNLTALRSETMCDRRRWFC